MKTLTPTENTVIEVDDKFEDSREGCLKQCTIDDMYAIFFYDYLWIPVCAPLRKIDRKSQIC